MIDFAIEEDVDCVLFAGDAFNKHNPDPTYLREFGSRIIRLSDHCPIVLLTGNHDVPGSVEKASSITLFDTLRVPNVVVGMNYEMLEIDTAHGILQVATVPYPFKNTILSYKEMHGKSRDKIEELFKKKFNAIIRNLGSQINESYPAILLAHLSVDTAIFGSERITEVGASAQVSLETLISDPWDYVALGHIHLFQNLTKDVEGEIPVVYSGSMERVNFGEEHDDKGFILINIGKETTYEFIQTDARPYVTIEADVSEKHNPTEYILNKISKTDIKSAVVRLVIHADVSKQGHIRQEAIAQAILDAGAYCIHSIVIKPIDRAYTARLGNVNISSIPKQDLLKSYFTSLSIKKSEIDELMAMAEDIMTEVENG
jgi:exonuclease SbcD